VKSNVSLLTLLSLSALVLGACNLQMVVPAADSAPVESPEPVEIVMADPGEARALPAIDLSGLPAGTTMRWYDNSLLVPVPAGEFVMGGDDPDNPEHVVVLDDFWAYKTMVTNDMYRLCVASGACTPPADELPVPEYLEPDLKDNPVVGVTWEQAGAYCTWMHAHLPSEAQWEKLARGTDGFTYPWGQGKPTCDLLNFEDCDAGATSRVYDHAPGLSPFEAADMAGNAYQWTGDWYAADYYNSSPDENPPGPETGTLRSVRGSSFRSPADQLASALRYGIAPETARDDLGFRCVVGADGFAFAPFCQLTAFVPGLDPLSPDPLVGDPGEAPPVEAAVDCDMDPPSASSTNYCADQGTHTGGATVTFSGELLEWDPGCVPGGSPIGCTGPEGVTLHVTVCTHCSSEGGLGVGIEPECLPWYDFVDGVCQFGGAPPLPGGDCPPGWVLDPGTGLCQAALPLPDSDLCPEGYSFYEPMSCCLAAFTETLPDIPGLPPVSYPGCPLGTFYDEASGYCLLEGMASGSVGENCHQFDVPLGYCANPGGDPGDDCQVQACGGQAPNWCQSLCACIGPADPCP
jgi:formylglycine-generating enzyme